MSHAAHIHLSSVSPASIHPPLLTVVFVLNPSLYPESGVQYSHPTVQRDGCARTRPFTASTLWTPAPSLMVLPPAFRIPIVAPAASLFLCHTQMATLLLTFVYRAPLFPSSSPEVLMFHISTPVLCLTFYLHIRCRNNVQQTVAGH
eukprot:GGOE01010484.1.p1 GENE.GGOE01010484.1~~GGOE01010484.1.p1  ORF type:complete len:146 (-),score=3.28 GGOE01010484.1:218-655(-)